jgi:hypothetical protein
MFLRNVDGLVTTPEVHICPLLTLRKLKLSPCLTNHYAMKTYGEVDVQIHVFWTPALVECEWSDSRPRRFNPVPNREEAARTSERS